MNKKQILERQTAIRTEMAELAAVDEFDTDQAERFTALDAEFKELDEKVAVIDRAASVRVEVKSGPTLADIARSAPRESSGFDRDPLGNEHDVERVSQLDNPWDIEVVRSTSSPEELHSRALSAIEMTPGPSDARRAALTGILERGEGDIAKIVLATTSPAYKTAYGKIIRSGGDVSRANLSRDEMSAVDFAQGIARAVTTTDANGGYLVPADIEPSVTLSSDGTNNPLYNLARRVQTTSDTYRVVSAPHAAWSWDGEASEVSDDTPAFANTDIPLHYAQGFVPISISGGQSIDNVTSIVSDVLMGGWNDLVGAALTTGTGSSQPTGLITALTGGAVASAAADTFAVGDVYALYEQLPGRYRRNATWQANVGAISDIRQFATDDGASLIARLGDADPQRLLGRPLVENEDMDASITAAAENYYLLLGDLSHFVIAEGIGMLTEVIPHVFGANGRPIGARGIYCATRFGSDVVNDSAFKLLNVT